jgi:GT2 family glycosyltransferase
MGLANTYRCVYEVPGGWPAVSVIVIAHGPLERLQRCLDSLRQGTDYPGLEVVVVEPGRPETGVEALVRGLPADRVAWRHVREGHPLTAPALANRAARAASAEVLCFLHPALAAVYTDWLQELVRLVLRPEVGAVGAKLTTRDHRLSDAGLVFPPGDGPPQPLLRGRTPGAHPFYAYSLYTARGSSAVSGACMAVRTALFQEAGGFDEGLTGDLSAADLCLRLRDRGYRVLWTPYAELQYQEPLAEARSTEPAPAGAGPTSDGGIVPHRQGRDGRRDPYYNPNLSPDPAYPLRLDPRVSAPVPWRSPALEGPDAADSGPGEGRAIPTSPPPGRSVAANMEPRARLDLRPEQ